MLKNFIRRLTIPWGAVIRYAILAATLMGSLIIGRLTLMFPMPLPLLFPVVIIAVPVMFFVLSKLEFGVLGIVLAAAMIRFGIPTGTQSEIVASLALTAAFVTIWLVKMWMMENRIYLRPSLINWPILGFVATCFISLVWSNVFRDVLVVTWDSWPFVQLGALGVMVLLPAALLFTANVIGDSRWLGWLTVIFVAIGAVVNFGYMLGWGKSLGFIQVRPLFPTWVMSLSFAQALFNRRLSWPMRIFLLAVTAGWFHEQFVNQIRWLSGWMPAAASLGVISVMKSRYLIVLLIVVMLAYGIVNVDDLMVRFDEEQTASGDTRLDAWLHNWLVTKEHWLFGVGPAGYAVYYMSYFPMEAMATHSTYIDVLSQTGVVGFIFFFWLFVALAISGWELVQRLKGHADFEEAFAVATLGGCMAAMLSMALGDWLVPFAYTQTIAGFDYAVYTWILLGGMMSLLHIVQARDAELESGEQACVVAS